MSPRPRPRGGPTARINDEDKQRVLDLIADGYTVSDAAADIGYTDRTVHREMSRDRQFFDAMARAAADGADKRRQRRRQRNTPAAP